jgi:hypothetical protein
MSAPVSPHAYNKNFSQQLVLLDFPFGAAHFPSASLRPSRYGVDEKLPEGFWRQIVHTFRRQRRRS